MEYFIHLAVIVSLYASLAVALNLLVGYTGILSVCHAAFYGIGAYTTAILIKSYGFSFFPTLFFGAVIAAIAALAIGLVLSKVDSDYYALGSFGFGIIVYALFLNWNKVTGGALGIFGIPRPTIFGFTLSSNSLFLILSLTVAAFITLLSYAITRSHFGRVLRAIRDDDAILAPFNYKTHWYKLTIFAITASFAAIVGSLYSVYISFIDPSSFTINESIYILTIVILGGLASLRGSILGAVILTLLPEMLRFIGLPSDIAAQTRVLIYGAALMYLMWKRPAGMLGNYTP